MSLLGLWGFGPASAFYLFTLIYLFISVLFGEDGLGIRYWLERMYLGYCTLRWGTAGVFWSRYIALGTADVFGDRTLRWLLRVSDESGGGGWRIG